MISSTKKVFVSYSWDVKDRVIKLVERLINDGVDVVIDIYDLKEGQDIYAFMEQSVMNPEIDRVLIICDETYANKANNRQGGVGDETIIISPKVYSNVYQEKFIPIIFQVDEENSAYLPVFLKGTSYINLAKDGDQYEMEYKKLLRNIYEKPLYEKPKLGKMPDWLKRNKDLDNTFLSTEDKKGKWIYSIIILDDMQEQLDMLQEEIQALVNSDDRYEVRIFTVTKATDVIMISQSNDIDVFVLDVARNQSLKWQTKEFDYFGYDLYKQLVTEKPNILIKSKFFVLSKLPMLTVKNEFEGADVVFMRKQTTSNAKVAQIIKEYLDSLYIEEYSKYNKVF